MAFKVLTYFFLVLFIQQVVGEDANALLGQLTIIVNKQVETSEAKIKEVQVNATNQVTAVINSTKSELTDRVDPMVGIINVLVNQVKKAGLDPQPCLTGIDVVTKAPYEQVDNVLGCLKNLLASILANVTKSLASIRGLLNIVPDLANSLKSCTGLLAALCIGRVVASITLQITKVPATALSIVGSAVSLITGVASGIGKCAVTRGPGVIAAAVKAACTIIVCLTKLLADAAK